MSRVGVLVIAAVVAIGSCFGLVRYSSGAQDRAVAASEPVPVMVAAKDVPTGMPFNTAWNEGRLAMSTIPQGLRPATAVTDPKLLTGLLAVAPLVQGQLVVQGSFSDPAKADHAGPPTFATQLPDGTVAVSFKAEAAQAVSDLIRPGDHVNLLVQVPNASVLGLPDSGGAAMVHVFQDLQIIAIGDVPMAGPTATEASKNPGTGLYTVAVLPQDSARLLLLSHEYDVYLTLVGPKTAPAELPPISDGDALPPVAARDDAVSILRQRILEATTVQDAETAVDVDADMDSRVAAVHPLRPNPAPPPPPPRERLPADVHTKVHRQIVRDLGPLLYDDAVPERDLEQRLQHAIETAFSENGAPLGGELFEQFARDVRNDVIGYGPIEEYLADESVTEIMVNGPDIVFVERAGKVIEVASGFVDGDHVRRVIDKIVSQVGRRIDEASPMVDARLPDGSRVNAIIQPLAIDGPFLTIRKFATEPFTAEDLIQFGTLDERSVRFLRACIEGRLNIIVSGGTGTGKTTLLNVLSSFIPNDERIVTVEDAKELQLHQRHVLCLETRPPNIEGVGAIAIRDLVRNSLRMRPDRIVVGECRGGEALDMLQAMNTGHDGSMTTVHSNSPRDALARIETLTLMAGFELPVRAIREQVASAVDLIVQLSRLRDGTRRVTHVTEVDGMEGEKITLQDIFLFDFSAGVDANTGKHRGLLQPTGVRPSFSDKLEDTGVELGADIFSANGPRTLQDRMRDLR